MPMSLLSAYNIKKKKSKQKKPKLEEADYLLAEIEKIAVSPETAKMWMEDPCLPPESIIETEDGPRRIAEIQIGTKVLTHQGYHKVSKVYCRHFNGKLVSLTPYYSNKPLLLTPGHPVMAVKITFCQHYKQYKVEWIPAGQLEKGYAVALCGVPKVEETSYAFQINGRLFVSLKNVERIPYNGLVYNLAVNPAETYVAEGIIVHNCGRPC